MKRFQNVLCVVDTSSTHSETVLSRAIELADHHQADLTVATVLDKLPTAIHLPGRSLPANELQEQLANECKSALENQTRHYHERVKLQTRLLIGMEFREIILEVLRRGHDLVIKSPESEDWLDKLLGSADMHLLRKCPCPVWLVNPGPAEPYHRIIAAVDVSEYYPREELETRRKLNQQILEIAASLAVSEFSELHIVHVWDAPAQAPLRGGFVRISDEELSAYIEQTRQQHEQELNSLAANLEKTIGKDAIEYIKPQVHLVQGRPKQQVPVMAKQIHADLIVMGTVARTGLPGLIMGNTAEAILNQIDCSVLAVKPVGFVSPISLEGTSSSIHNPNGE